MLEVTCYHCGQVVQISPDAERCSVCGMNLRKLIGREQASSYFYVRAADFAGAGNVLGALQEVQRGLAYVTTSELNLLGAILCKRLGRWDDMRHYVAAIPADDALRGEGEWLLRSNQARQRPPVPPPSRNKAPVALPVIPDSDALPVVLDEVAPSPNHLKPVRAGRGLAALVALTLLAVLGGSGWIAWQSGLLDGLPLPGMQVAEQAAPPQAGVQPEAPGVQSGAPAATILPAGFESGPGFEPATAPSATDEPAATPQEVVPSLLLPTPTIAPNLAQGAPISQSIASASDAQAVAATDLTSLDWRTWLEGRDRPDLAALPVTMRVDGQTLVLEGTVEYAEQRAALEFEANQAPGVAEVSIVNVKLRPPQTYTVQEGDSLWAISVRIYGDPDQVEELYAANRDQMASAGDLRVGMVLAVPAVE